MVTGDKPTGRQFGPQILNDWATRFGQLGDTSWYCFSAWSYFYNLFVSKYWSIVFSQAPIFLSSSVVVIAENWQTTTTLQSLKIRHIGRMKSYSDCYYIITNNLFICDILLIVIPNHLPGQSNVCMHLRRLCVYIVYYTRILLFY